MKMLRWIAERLAWKLGGDVEWTPGESVGIEDAIAIQRKRNAAIIGQIEADVARAMGQEGSSS